MKTIAIMQPYLFPYLGYFQLAKASDKFVLYDDVNFIKQGWIHRNRIAGSLLFSVPLSKPSQNKLISETLIHDTYSHWKPKFLKTLSSCYSQYPYYSRVSELITDILDCVEAGEPISRLCKISILEIYRYLGLNLNLVASSCLYQNQHLRGTSRILDICLQEKATIYLNSIGGTELYRSEDFQEQGITLKFLKKGTQSNNLSIIDSLMLHDPGQINQLLDDYQLLESPNG